MSYEHWSNEWKDHDEIINLREENNKLKLQITIATTALECIEDPRKINHSERDDYTQKACLMNVAHVALKVMRGEYVEV